jgi:hypothetical protein
MNRRGECTVSDMIVNTGGMYTWSVARLDDEKDAAATAIAEDHDTPLTTGDAVRH